MARICFPTTKNMLDIIENSDGTIKRISTMMEEYGEVIMSQIKMANASYASQGTTDECIEKLALNQSDIAPISLPYTEENEIYKIPVPWYTLSIDIISGYNVEEYLTNLTSKPITRFGLLQNVNLYDYTVYATSLTVIIIFLIILTSQNHIHQSKKRKNRRKSLFKYYILLINRTIHSLFSENKQTLNFYFFLFHCCISLILMPFIILFSTSQVVTEKANVIVDFPSIIKSKATVMLMANKKYDFANVLTSRNDKNFDVNQMVKYIEGNHMIQKSPTGAKSLAEYIEYPQLLTKRSYVFLVPSFYAPLFHATLCSFSKPPKLIHLLTFHDEEHTLDRFSGYIIRKKYSNNKMTKRFRQIFEMDAVKFKQVRFPPLVGFKYTGAFGSFKSQQTNYCLDKNLKAITRGETFASDIDFFKLFWILLCFIILFATFTFFLEKKLQNFI